MTSYHCILPEKSTFFRFWTLSMCADLPVSLLNINICISKMLHIFKWFCWEEILWIQAGFLFYTKTTQTTIQTTNFFCFCSQTLFVLRPLMAWKPHSGKLFSDIVMCLLAKSQEIIVEADCSDRGKQIICISSFGKRDLEKHDGEGNDWPLQTYCHSTITVGN